MQQIDTLVVGCTGVGLGLALSNPSETLVIESTAALLPEWVQTYVPGNEWDTYQAANELTQRIQADMKKRSIQTDRGVHITGLSALMAQLSKEHKINALFMTHILGVEAQADGFKVDIVNVGGHSSIYCKRIIDTSSRFLSDPNKNVKVNKRQLSFYLRPIPGKDIAGEHTDSSYAFAPGAFINEASVIVDVDPHMHWHAARNQANEFWVNRPEPLRSWNCVAMSTQFFEQVEVVQTGHAQWQHVPAMHELNALAGIDSGVALAAQGVLS